VRRWALFLGIICCVSLPALGQQRPLKTDDAELLEVGRIRTELGFEFLQKQKYSLSGLAGDLTRAGVASVQVGLGEYAEFQISGVFQDFLSVSQRSVNPPIPPAFTGNSTSDFGDLILATKIKLTGEKGARPALAFKFAVELPNAKHDSGLGTDQTEFYASVLLSKHVGRARLLGNLGLAILGNPVVIGRQADVLTYGAGIVVPVHPKLNLVAEINGRKGPSPERVGNEDQSVARMGVQLQAAGLRWDLGGLAGFKRFDADSGVYIGITYVFKAFHK
jgi:hypothetical protein